MSLKATSREIGGVIVVDLDGRITLGDGSALLRDLIRENLNKGHKKLVLNLAAISLSRQHRPWRDGERV